MRALYHESAGFLYLFRTQRNLILHYSPQLSLTEGAFLSVKVIIEALLLLQGTYYYFVATLLLLIEGLK